MPWLTYRAYLSILLFYHKENKWIELSIGKLFETLEQKALDTSNSNHPNMHVHMDIEIINYQDPIHTLLSNF